MKYNKGFAVWGIVAIVVGILVVGGGAYYMGTNKSVEKEKVEDFLAEEKQEEVELNYNTSNIKESKTDKNQFIYSNSDFSFSYNKNRFLENISYTDNSNDSSYGKEGVYVIDCSGTDEKCITSSLLFSVYVKKDIKTMNALKTFLENEILEWDMSSTCGIKPIWSNNSKINNLESIQVNRSVCVGGGSGEKYPVPIIGTIYNNKAYVIDFKIGEYTGTEKIEFDNLVSSFKFIDNSEESVITKNDVTNQLVYIKSIYVKNGKYYMDVDYTQWMVCDGGTMVGCENGYEIINENPLIRTFQVLDNVTVKMQTFSHQTAGIDKGNFNWNEVISLSKFKGIIDGTIKPSDYEGSLPYVSWFKELPYRITVKNNLIAEISEQYIP